MKTKAIKNLHRFGLPAVVSLASMLHMSAHAFEIKADDPDIKMRWDQTLRYNAGWRMQSPKWDLAATASPTNGASGVLPAEKKFQKGDMVNNRIDLLTEFDFIYKEHTGFRISAAAWYDQRYNNHSVDDRIPNGTAGGGYSAQSYFGRTGHSYPDEVQRYYNGPSGQFLDAFIFHQFKAGDVPIDVKLGQHTVYWGESLFALGRGVNDGQAPVDVRKLQVTPGIEAKELFMPIKQISASAAITPNWTVFGQYFFDYRPSPFPLGGSFFNFNSYFTYSGATTASTTGATWNGQMLNGLDKSGEFGIGTKFNSELLDATVGLYYRQYYSKTSSALVILPAAAGFVNQRALLFDPEMPKTKLYGLSLSKGIGGTSVGVDLSYRQDQNLSYRSFAGTFNGASLKGWAPAGDVWAGVLNTVAYFNKNALYDSAVLSAEFDFDAMDKVTRNPQNYNGRINCRTQPQKGGGYYGCSTSLSYGIAARFTPTWFQVWEGVDLSAPIFYGIGLKGNSSIVAIGTNEGMGSYAVGLTANVNNKYEFSLNYAGQIYKRRMGPTPAGGPGFTPVTNASLGDNSDRDRITFTAKYGF